MCPGCKAKGKAVKRLTMDALLKPDFIGQIGDEPYHFCDSKDCDVVYFSEARAFTKDQMRVAVGVKEYAGERPLCYCFGHSVASIKNELVATGETKALHDIRAKMDDPGCRCETENPSGSCCLGNVAKGIKIAQGELNMHDPDVQTPSICGETVARFGAVISAIVASACCWLPLVLLAIGVSGAGIAATLDAYRPFFMVVTFGFLAVAFYLTYRPRKSAETEHGCCAPNAKRFSMMGMNKVMLWGVTLLSVAFLFFPNYVGALLGHGDKATVTEKMNRAVLKIEGMTCEGCASTVAEALRATPGVVAIEVDYDKGQAIIGTEACSALPTKRILAALEKAGYRGEFVESGEADCCAHAPAVKTANRTVDRDRQIVFAVQGLTCPAVRGIGCGHRLAPVLARLDKIEGVEASAANHTGTMLRFTLMTGIDREQATAIVQTALQADDRQPVRVEGENLLKALNGETWREKQRIRELSAIEFRKLAMQRIETFAENDNLTEEATAKLVTVAGEEWDRLAETVEAREATKSPRTTDWKSVATSFSAALCERAREFLEPGQLDRLQKMLAERIERLPAAVDDDASVEAVGSEK